MARDLAAIAWLRFTSASRGAQPFDKVGRQKQIGWNNLPDDRWLIIGYDQRPHGPYSTEQLRRFLEVGRITRDSLVIRQGTSARIRVAEVPGLLRPKLAPTPTTRSPVDAAATTTTIGSAEPIAGPLPTKPRDSIEADTPTNASVHPPLHPKEVLRSDATAAIQPRFHFPASLVSGLLGLVRAAFSRDRFLVASTWIWVMGQVGFGVAVATTEGLLIQYLVQSPQGGPLAVRVAWAAVISIPLLALGVHYLAEACCRQCDRLVTNTTTRISGFAAFEAVGGLLAIMGLLGLVVQGNRFGELISRTTASPFDYELAWICVGFFSSLLVLLAGLICLSPGLMNVQTSEHTSAEQDGITIWGAPLKAMLAACRIAAGFGGMIGGAMIATGGAMWLASRNASGSQSLSIGIGLACASTVAPMFIYLFGTYYYVFVDVLDAIVSIPRLLRPSASGSPESTSSDCRADKSQS